MAKPCLSLTIPLVYKGCQGRTEENSWSLTAALIISFAKANPVAIVVRNCDAPTADGNLKRGELAAASPASHYDEYIPTATETTLTCHYYEERATCLDRFIWYCSVPAAVV